MSKLIDLSGKDFGMLHIVKRMEDRKKDRPMWLCACKCGNTAIVSSTALTKPNGTRSCGCAQHQLKHDLRNQEFGYLKVIEPIENEQIKGNETRWRCLCQNCGRIVEVGSYWLRHGDPYGHCKCTRFNKPHA